MRLIFLILWLDQNDVKIISLARFRWLFFILFDDINIEDEININFNILEYIAYITIHFKLNDNDNSDI